MSYESLTDTDIQRLIQVPKRAVNAGLAKVKQRPDALHDEWTVQLEDDEGRTYSIYTRQSRRLKSDFSCGLKWNGPSGDLTLLRCNGSAHDHPPLGFVFHIHKTSARAIQERKKPEAYAEATTAYDSLEGAKHVLVTTAHITGIQAPAPHPQLLP